MLKNSDFLGNKFKFKISLSFSTTLNDATELKNNNPIYNLLSDFSEIEDIMKIDKPQKMKFFYFNRNLINKLLYNKDKVIEINSSLMQNKISDYFYLSLLIEYKNNTINLTYTYNFIKKLNDEINSSNNGALKEVIMSKFILELINNYKGINEFYANYNKIKNELNDLEVLNRKTV